MDPVTVIMALAGAGKPVGEWALSGTSGLIGNAMWAEFAAPSPRVGQVKTRRNLT